MKTIIVLTIITFLLLTKLNSQNYNIARECLNQTHLFIKINYPHAYLKDDTYTLNYKDGQILLFMEESLCYKVCFVFYSNETFYQFVSNNKEHWYKVGIGKYEDIRYSKIIIIQDSLNGVYFLTIKNKLK